MIDDYGHHPVEIKVTLKALKDAYPTSNIVLVFQPHRYTRTRDLFNDFIEVLSQVHKVIILEVYAAGEDVISEADGMSLVGALRNKGVDAVFAADLDTSIQLLSDMELANGLILTTGAGSISKLPQMLLDKFS